VPEERFEIGAHVLASDGECGELVRVVVDPVKQALTHLVVAPKHHHGLDKLVALEAVESVEGDHRCGLKQVAIPIGAVSRVGLEVQVDLTKQQIEDLPPVELG
jgi:sporulation protein YlmC with PRC-barrel domain